MKMKKVITAVAVVSLSATLAFAAPHGDRGGRGRHGGKQGMLRGLGQLDLTDAQKAQIKSIHQASREQNKAFFESARQLRADLRAAKEANDTAKVQSLQATMDAQRPQFKQIRDAEMQQVLNVLTPEQRAKYETKKAERDARRGNGEGKRKPRG